MLSQSELRVSQDFVGNSQSLGTRALPPSWLVAAAAEVLSTPRKWFKGSGQWPFKRQPRPLAPRPPPLGLAGRCWGWELGLADGRDGADRLDLPTRAGVG